MRRLKNTSLVPPDDFRYVDPDTGVHTTSRTYDDWVSTAANRRRFNNLPVPLDLEMRMQDQLCGVIPPEYCERDAGDVSSWVNTRFTWADVTEGMKVFTHWGALGMPLVEQAEANRRAGVCLQCPLNVNVTGCAACHKAASFLTGSVARKTTPYDDSLKVCGICHCVNRAQVWIPIDILQGSESAEHQALRPEFCWRRIGGSNYAN